jgi:bidirectional [NiFe] hydrogenase diaphorase subunit
MSANPTKLDPPSEDKRWRIVAATMRRYGYASDALIETLHSVQETFGYLDDDALRYVAANLKIPPSRVYGVATFYDFFTLKPKGEHTCVVCMGTACYIKGGANILSAIEKKFGLTPGGTTPDDKASLVVARCLGACGLAPATVFDGEVVGKADPETVVGRIGKWTEDAR